MRIIFDSDQEALGLGFNLNPGDYLDVRTIACKIHQRRFMHTNPDGSIEETRADTMELEVWIDRVVPNPLTWPASWPQYIAPEKPIETKPKRSILLPEK